MKGSQQTILISFIASFLFTSNNYSQQATVVTGGSGSGSGGIATYSVGQIVYKSISGSGGSISQGVQQAYEITVLGKDGFTEINLVMTAYPNPTTDVVNLIVVNDKLNNLSYNLFDINGKIISKKSKITSAETSVSMQELNQGIYFLSINDNNKTIKTFKIIKK